jgi:hypothetical protein
VPPVTTYYLQMHSSKQLRARTDAGGLQLIEAQVKQFRFNRFLYQLVGSAWQWTDQLNWSDQQWRNYAEADSLRTWVAYFQGAPAGYFELQRQPDDEVQIMYFGLAPAFIGRGFGGYLLSSASCLGAYLLTGPPRRSRQLPGQGHAAVSHRDSSQLSRCYLRFLPPATTPAGCRPTTPSAAPQNRQAVP